MNRIHVIATVGLCAAAGGLILALQADSLATHWQPTESGNGWGGTTDPALAQTYYTVGLVGLCFGLALVALAAWRWLAGEPVLARREVPR
jgi:hypothetical protein